MMKLKWNDDLDWPARGDSSQYWPGYLIYSGYLSIALACVIVRVHVFFLFLQLH